MKKMRIAIFIITFFCLFIIWEKIITIDRNLSSDFVEEMPIDYLLLGSSHMYHGVNPLEIWEKTGFTGYNLGTDLQMPATSYFVLKEYLDQGNIPKVVFFDFYGFTLVDGNASFNLETASRYPMSLDKINYIKNIKADERLTMIFPFLQFHARWDDLNKADYTFEKNNGTYSFMGYLPTFNSYEFINEEFYPTGYFKDDYIPSEDLLNEFERVYSLCKDNNIELVLIKTPTTEWTQTVHSVVKEYFADNYGIDFIDFNDFYREIGFNPETDFEDEFHVNDNGAKKITDYLANYMKENYNFTDKHNLESAEVWDEKYIEYLHYIQINRAVKEQSIEAYLSGFTSKDYLVLTTSKENNSVEVAAQINGEMIAQKIDKTKASVNFEYDNQRFYIESTKEFNQKESKIQVDLQNYSQNIGDVSVVIYDLVFNRVVSSRSY